MTREYFVDNVNEIWELMDWCSNNGCDLMDDVYSDEEYDEVTSDDLYNWIQDGNDWRDIRDWLNDRCTGYSYYRKDDWGEWYGVDDGDAEEYKDDILRWADEAGIWEEEEEEEEEPVPEEEFEEEEPQEEEDDFGFDEEVLNDIAFDNLFSSSVDAVNNIMNDIQQKSDEATLKEIADEEKFLTDFDVLGL